MEDITVRLEPVKYRLRSRKDESDRVVFKEVEFPGNDILEYNNISIEKQILSVFQDYPEYLMLARSFCEYIKAPIILDVFDNHPDRRAYQEQLRISDKELYAVYKSNKLGKSKIRNVLQAFDYLYGEKFITELSLKRMVDDLWSCVSSEMGKDMLRYAYSSEEKKIEISHKVAEFSRNTCIHLIEKSA